MSTTFKSWFLPLLTFIVLGCSTGEQDLNSNAPEHDIAPGASAHDFLSDAHYRSLEVEIVYVTGYAPSEQTLSILKNFLQKYTDKPQGIKFLIRSVPAPGVGKYSVSELRKIEKEYRTVYSKEARLGVYIFFADKTSDSDSREEVTLGKAYYNTSIVIFDKQIREMTYSDQSITAYQQTTLRHEFGHLFGLVDNGTPAQSPHEDPDPAKKGHCSVAGCLMSAYLGLTNRTTEGMQTYAEGLDFDPKCWQDLRSNGGK